MTLRPGDYLRTPRGWARVTRIDPTRGHVCEDRAPLDDRDLPGAGCCSLPEFVRAMCGVTYTRAGPEDET